MMLYLPIVLLVSLASSGVAAPGKGRATCEVKASGTNKTDDAPAIRKAFEDCGHGGKIVFKSTTYYVNSILNISGLNDVDIDIQGKLLVGYAEKEAKILADDNALVEYRYHLLAQPLSSSRLPESVHGPHNFGRQRSPRWARRRYSRRQRRLLVSMDQKTA